MSLHRPKYGVPKPYELPEKWMAVDQIPGLPRIQIQGEHQRQRVFDCLDIQAAERLGTLLQEDPARSSFCSHCFFQFGDRFHWIKWDLEPLNHYPRRIWALNLLFRSKTSPSCRMNGRKEPSSAQQSPQSAFESRMALS